MSLIRRPFFLLALSGCWALFATFNFDSSLAAALSQKKRAPADKAAVETVLAYATAISQGDRATFGKLDFSCQYRLLTGLKKNLPPSSATIGSLYDRCWREMTDAHAHTLTRTDMGMDVLWPSTGPLVFFGDDVLDLPPSAFVMDSIGVSPPGSGLHLTVANSRHIPDGSFRLKPDGNVVGVPATVVEVTVHYQDPLTSPVTYAPGTVRWTNTVKRARGALKSITTQWVVFSRLKKHGFSEDSAVFLLPVPTEPETAQARPDTVPFTTERSRAIPNSLTWWSPQDQPGTLAAAAVRAAAFPDLRDRVALLNRILLIDPRQTDALTVLSRHLYTALLRQAADRHNLAIKDPALARAVNEFYWNIYSASARLDLANTMEMGGLTEPTPADFLYRMLPPMETLAETHPEQLDNRFRLGMAYRWNNDQLPMIQTFESLVQDIPEHRKTPKAEALLQLAWSRINKVAWNRILHDPDSVKAYADAERALALAELPIDKFLAEYTMAYCMIFMPNYGEKATLLHHLTEAKRWFDQIADKHEQDDVVWRYFLNTELLKAVLDADPMFQPILASNWKERG
ncbi:hypothetical protein [Candidatus Nitrospira inopinata]|uniref:Uncharacterized protein n=1 Tax=Candidatus Nitrospira inopinata TaxID=1715989 RepID=A0A0S4KTB7_9BACT|nr:hypothetical protein [Candidatus Nitrospira inopinata]CUQ66382.1 conserved exported protein of unknown function [Candidatus Nitrospira inopinata]